MKRFLVSLAIVLMGIAAVTGCQSTNKQLPKKPSIRKASGNFTDTFTVKKADFSPNGTNSFFILEPGYSILLKGTDEGKPATEETKVLNETKIVDGVQTRIVKETHTLDGEVDEISLNYFAIDRVSNGVFYFGEDTDTYENGKVVSHEGSWHSGEKGAKFGLIMPSIQLLGGRYMQEIAPGVALDRAEIVSLTAIAKTPSRTLKKCLKVKETTPFEPGVQEFKLYAEGIGKVQDVNLKLVSYGFQR